MSPSKLWETGPNLECSARNVCPERKALSVMTAEGEFLASSKWHISSRSRMLAGSGTLGLGTLALVAVLTFPPRAKD